METINEVVNNAMAIITEEFMAKVVDELKFQEQFDPEGWLRCTPELNGSRLDITLVEGTLFIDEF